MNNGITIDADMIPHGRNIDTNAAIRAFYCGQNARIEGSHVADWY